MNIRRSILVFLICIFLINFTFTKQTNYPENINNIISKGNLTVAIYNHDKPPFFMKGKDGNLEGVDINIAKDIAKLLGVKLKINRDANSYDEFVDLLNSNKVDLVISKYSRTFKRLKSIKFSKPYVKLKQSFVINKADAAKNNYDKKPLKYLKKNKIKVGVMKKTSYKEYAKLLFKKAEIVEYEKWLDAISDVSNGKITVALYDDNEILKLIRKNPELALYVSAFILKDKIDPISIGVKHENLQLLDFVNAYLETYNKDKTVSDLIKEYPNEYK